MKNLVTLTGNSSQPITTSKIIAEVFDKEHKHVLRDIDSLKDVSNFGLMFYETTEQDSYGRQQRVYQMNRDGFSLLAMGFTGQKALEWKVKYIEAFNAMEQQLNTPELQMAHGLLAAKTLIEQKDKLIAEQKQIIEEQKPKADYFDALVDKKLNTNIRDTAKELGVKEKVFVNFLLENGFVYRQGKSGKLRPYAQYCESGSGLFVLKDAQNENNGWAGQQMLITPKGKETFRLLLERRGEV